MRPSQLIYNWLWPVLALLAWALPLGCDSPRDQRNRAVKHACERHFAHIHAALVAYANQNNGVLPDSLETLAMQGHLSLLPSVGDPDPLICAAAPTPQGYVEPRTVDQWHAGLQKGFISYRLCTPRAALDTAVHTPLVIAIEAYHLEGGCVLYADGKVELLSEDAFGRVSK